MRTLLDECFRIAGRTTWYISPEEIQRDLDRFLDFYNLERSHQGYRLEGRAPAQALREALGRKKLPPIVPKENAQVRKQATQSAAGDPDCRVNAESVHLRNGGMTSYTTEHPTPKSSTTTRRAVLISGAHERRIHRSKSPVLWWCTRSTRNGHRVILSYQPWRCTRLTLQAGNYP